MIVDCKLCSIRKLSSPVFLISGPSRVATVSRIKPARLFISALFLNFTSLHQTKKDSLPNLPSTPLNKLGLYQICCKPNDFGDGDVSVIVPSPSQEKEGEQCED